MRTFDVFPNRGNRSKWCSLVAFLALAMAMTGIPSWNALAQATQQTQAQVAAEQKTEQPAEIKLAPVSLVGPIERAEKEGTALRLSLRDVTKMALQNNLNIAIADTNEELRQQSLIQARAAYDPSLRFTFSSSNSNSMSTQVTTSAESGYISSSQNGNLNTTFTKPIPTGGSISMSWNSSRRNSNNANDLTKPNYSTSGSLNFSQPLWRNLKIDSNRNSIKTANLDLQINDSQFRNTLTSTIAQIHSAYWDLVSAINSYNISRNGVELTRLTVAQNQKKVEIGTAAPITVTESLASQAQKEVSLISSEERILTAQNSLRNLISKDRSADIWGQTIVPTDQPEFVEFNIDLNTAIETALKNRPELEQADLNLTKNDLTYKLQQNNKKWQIDANASIGAQGTGGVQAFRERNGVLTPVLLPDYVGGLLTSYKTVFLGDTYNWSLGLSVNIPLSNRSADASLATTRIQRQQQLMQRTQQEQSIIVEVRNQVQALNTAKRQLDTAKIGTQLGIAKLDAENKRLEAGLSQNYLVLQAQDSLLQARNSELNAQISYRRAILNLQRAMFTLLDANDIDTGTGVKKSAKPLTFK